MSKQEVSRRTLLKDAGTALAGLTVLQVAGPAQAFPQDGQGRSGEPDASLALQQVGVEVIPWLDQPRAEPHPRECRQPARLGALDSFRTPADNFFFVNHYGQPTDLDEATWRVGIGGLVRRPQSLSLADIKARARHEVDFTLECSGNNGIGLDFFIGGIGNARWGGARLAPLLEEAGVLDEAQRSGLLGSRSRHGDHPRQLGNRQWRPDREWCEPDLDGGLDLTITEQFARSMSLEDALSRDNLLCYEMNGDPLPPEHGFPVRLIAPGWYGVANVKWLTRIEVMDHRYAGRFMARDYVSIREEQRDGQTVWTFTTVGHDRLKSAPAKVTRHGNRYTIMGAAWGAPIAAVQVRIDDGPWSAATLYGPAAQEKIERLRLEVLDVRLGAARAGRARITSRAFDIDGNIQPAPDDPFLASQRTYWESNGHITRRVLIP